MFSFLPLINNSVTVGLSFLLLIISAIGSSSTINTLHFLLGLYSSIFYENPAYYLNIEEKLLDF